MNPPRKDTTIRGASVLIADDMNFHRHINKQVLKRMGAIVHEATDGTHALKMLQSTHYDIVIMDIHMPVLSGIEVVKSIRATANHILPKFIALSAHATPKMEATCLEIGFDHFIEKPLSPKKLENLLGYTIEVTSTAPLTIDNSLLNYLADNDPNAIAALELRCRMSFIQEIEQLELLLQGTDLLAIHASIHKLKGLTGLKKDRKLSDLLGLITSSITVTPAKHCPSSLCQQMRQHIEQA
ncbi:MULTISPECIES: response regulator [unclassified Lentimonas]|uniref:response regulator n=1 Tax=unclassified Lentimonas TaxID=2630993 RepID=UPI00132B7EA4|nr:MULTISPECIES: response regulator [unclassified Lentimonas]CAA6678433.1 Unannotated [Lentimonas sp. CC4]CAA6685525.1 Unannotated [Lentimonas sp. CC6]CAA6689728.1 Unannotated [Lentimonas sp. CC19]CAA6690491.1 Unannotated [Lentimonas sp. CC10]CAA7068749.1 Unannotated [Lentimonas sp. CC11]